MSPRLAMVTHRLEVVEDFGVGWELEECWGICLVAGSHFSPSFVTFFSGSGGGHYHHHGGGSRSIPMTHQTGFARTHRR